MMEHMNSFPVTVAVVTYNEEHHIGDCIQSIIALNYPTEFMEILIVDGCSEDSTQEIVKQFMKEDPRIRLVENPGHTIASNRNRGLKEARFRYVAFTDADCEVPVDWLKILVEAYRRHKAVDEALTAVGGANVPPPGDVTPFVEALGLMLNTYLGSLGSVQGRIYDMPRTVDSLACLNILYDRDRVLSLGGFDTDMKNIGEDAELHYRMRQNGYRLLYVPESKVFHKLRSTIVGWARNMFNYGRGRVVMFRKHQGLVTFNYLLPLFFLGTFALVPLAAVSNIFWLPMAYFPAIFLYSLCLAGIQKRPGLAGWLMLGFFTTHWSYALGMFYQLISMKKRL
jgi:succinoglycan biosynthesis protein ExoA